MLGELLQLVIGIAFWVSTRFSERASRTDGRSKCLTNELIR